MNNGITFNNLVDHVICVRCMVYYEDEGFGAPEAINFTAYDAYHTEKVMDYTYNRKEVSLKQLDEYLKNTAAVSTDTPIIISCTLDSPHKALVDLLDICYKYKLYSVSVFSL